MTSMIDENNILQDIEEAMSKLSDESEMNESIENTSNYMTGKILLSTTHLKDLIIYHIIINLSISSITLLSYIRLLINF